MKNNFFVLENNMLFDKISQNDFKTMFSCLGAYEKSFEKKEIVALAGDRVDFLGIVISGSVKLVRTDENGNETILSEISEGDSFGEALACAEVYSCPFTIISSQKTEILFLNYAKLIKTCNNSCVFHSRLIENLLKLIAHKNIYLNQKIEIISKRTLREKILCYFDFERKGKKIFEISLNREDFASYICADRSALSAELSKMQKEGILLYNKNKFEILY